MPIVHGLDRFVLPLPFDIELTRAATYLMHRMVKLGYSGAISACKVGDQSPEVVAITERIGMRRIVLIELRTTDPIHIVQWLDDVVAHLVERRQ